LLWRISGPFLSWRDFTDDTGFRKACVSGYRGSANFRFMIAPARSIFPRRRRMVSVLDRGT
jgi:hypothetical protein